MKIKTKHGVMGFLAVALIWMAYLVLSGNVDSAWMFAILFGGGYSAAKLVTDDKVKEASKTANTLKELQEQHRKEVEKVEETDYTAHMSDADLIAHANERERERARTTIR
jgi:flagellar biosynthesis component FlhA